MYYIFVKKNYFEAEYWSTLRFSTTILIYTHYFAMKIILIICQGVRLFKTCLFHDTWRLFDSALVSLRSPTSPGQLNYRQHLSSIEDDRPGWRSAECQR